MEGAVWYYFGKKYKYTTILEFLESFHDIKISKRTLLNKLKEYGLSRRTYNANEEQVRQCIQRELDGSGQLLGHRAMWRRLRSKYMDPEGTKLRRSHQLKRREYLNPGPNHCWHTNGTIS